MTIPMGEVQMTEQVMLTALRQHHRYADLLVYAQELNDFINECKRDEEWHGDSLRKNTRGGGFYLLVSFLCAFLSSHMKNV